MTNDDDGDGDGEMTKDDERQKAMKTKDDEWRKVTKDDKYIPIVAPAGATSLQSIISNNGSLEAFKLNTVLITKVIEEC